MSDSTRRRWIGGILSVIMLMNVVSGIALLIEPLQTESTMEGAEFRTPSSVDPLEAGFLGWLFRKMRCFICRVTHGAYWECSYCGYMLPAPTYASKVEVGHVRTAELVVFCDRFPPLLKI